MRKFLILIIAVCLTLTLVACGGKSEIMLGKKELSYDGYYSISYTRFSGSKTIPMSFSSDQTVDVSVLTTLGKIDVEIFGLDEYGKYNSYFYGQDVQTSVSPIALKQGSYDFVFTADKHTGGFTIEYLPLA